MVGDKELKDGDFRNLEVDVVIPIFVFEYTRFVTTAADVIHSLALPSMGMKIDAIPGRLNQQCIFPNFLGMFYGQCSELCGVNHRFMPICVEVVHG